MNSITEEQIKDILSHRDEKLKNIHTKILNLYEELDHDVILSELALTSAKIDGMPKAGGMHKDMGDLLNDICVRRYQRADEVREMMWEISLQEEQINRVWACFQVLDNPFYGILDSLYVKNQLYDAVQMDSGMARKTFEKYRKEGIRLLIRFYESGDPPVDIMRKYRSYRSKNRPTSGKKKQPEKGQYEQITLDDLE